MMLAIIFQALFVLVVLCVTLLYFYIRRRYGYWKERGIPYAKPTIFVGNLGHYMRKSSFDFMYELSKKYKTDYLGIYLGWKPALLINSKELVKQVIVKDFDVFQNRFTYPGDKDDPLGALNLFTVKNPIWSAMRHEVAPMFTSLRLKGLTELMNVSSAELVQRIQTDYIENKKTVNLKEIFTMYTSDIIGYTVFGLRVSVLKDFTSPLWLIAEHMVHWTFWRGFEFTMFFFVPDLAKLLRLKFFSKTATDYVRQLFWRVADERKKQMHPNDKDLLNHLMKLKDNWKLPVDPNTQLADDLMIAQAAVFIMGSIETSSTTLTCCFHELAHHPDKQERLYSDIKNVFEAKKKDVLDFSDLLELNYLTACIKETIRKYPPVPVLDRVCMKTYKLTDEVTIEAGTPVYINLTGIHYNEKYFPNPEEWHPERFEFKTENDNNDYSFLGFGEGPRACIGKRFGIMQVRTAIVHILKKYRLEPVEDYLLESDPYSFAYTPKKNVRVKFIPRQ